MEADESKDQEDLENAVEIWQGYGESLLLQPLVQVKKVKNLAFGQNHLLILTENGEVFSKGSNSHGQLGNGTVIDSLERLVKIHFPYREHIVSIACGARHSGIITSDGNVFMWGDNADSQCAADDDILLIPSLVDIIQPYEDGFAQVFCTVRVLQLACGDTHTLALSKDLEIWAWGSGKALGLLSISHSYRPQRIEYLRGRYVISVSCGSNHSLALVSSSVVNTNNTFSKSSKQNATSETDIQNKPIKDVQNANSPICPLGLPIENSLILTVQSGSLSLLKQLQKMRHLEYRKSDHESVEVRDRRFSEGNTPLDTPVDELSLISSFIQRKGKFLPHNNEKIYENDEKQAEELNLNNKEADVREVKGNDNGENKQEDENSWEVIETKNESLTEESLKSLPKNQVTTSLKAKLLRSMSETAVGNRILNASKTLDLAAKEADKVSLQEFEDNKGDNNSSDEVNSQDLPTEEDEARSPEFRRQKSSPSFIDSQSAKEFLAQRLSSIASAMSPSALANSKDSVFVYESATEAIRQNVSALTNMVMTGVVSGVVSGVRNTVDRFSFVSKHLNRDYDVIVLNQQEGDLMITSEENLRQYLEEEDEAGVSSLNTVESGLDALTHCSVPLTPGDSRKGSVYRAQSLNVGVKRKMSKSERVHSCDVASLQDSSRIHNPEFSKCLESRELSDEEKSILETEVWSWGCGHQGQLGQGDAMDRLQPCCIKILKGQGIIKLVAGISHSIALCASGQIYVWGNNSHGQLGNGEISNPEYTPKTVKIESSALVWDIAAGAKHTLFLADRGVQTEIYYCGKQEGPVPLHGVVGITRPSIVSVTSSKQIVRQVFAGGPFCGCVCDHPSPYLITLHELAASERYFYQTLTLLRNTVFLPITKDASYAVISSSPFGLSIQELEKAFQQVWEQVSLNNYCLGMALQQDMPEASLLLITDRLGNWLSSFERYACAFYDLLSMNGFAFWIKTASNFFSKIQPFKKELGTEKGLEDKSSADALVRLLEEPIRRMAEYQRTLDILAEQFKQGSKSYFRELEASKHWSKMVSVVNWEKECAEETKAFWESCPQKLADALRNSSRRLVRDSKTHPLSLPGSGRFSSHWFILFNDIFVHAQFSGHLTYSLPLIWVDPIPDSESMQNAFTLTMPEDSLTLQCPSTQEKTEWVFALNHAIRASLSKVVIGPVGSRIACRAPAIMKQCGVRHSPPLIRSASYTFTKKPQLKDTTYKGTWLCAQLHGSGELTWPDGRKYTGKFKQNIQCGDGLLIVPTPEGNTISEGTWQDGKLNGLGSIRYPNGDLYEGYFKDGQCHGHGILKKGQFLSSAASIYIGEWVNSHRKGYGVMDDIVNGDKYMGMWQDDCRHGMGMVVTLDGIYYEGNFIQNKMMGFGLMMFEDNSWYEGEFGGSGGFNGKGTLTLASGDKLEGYFYGPWNEGIKINGTFHKANSSSPPEFTLPSSFGTLSVPAERKWEDIFQHCYELLGIGNLDEPIDSHRVWDTVAVIISEWKKKLIKANTRSYAGVEDLDGLDKIPQIKKGILTLEDYHDIQAYLTKAFDTSYHPLGKLLEGLVDVYRATYIGVGAHPRLLPHAVQEVKSFINRIYKIVRILFPDLPPEDQELTVKSSVGLTTSKVPLISESEEEEDIESEIVTPSALLLPSLLPRIYPPLFTLYALHNEKDDDRYWETLLKWNRQSDLALMEFLGVDHKFRYTGNNDHSQAEQALNFASIKDQHFSQAIDALQHLSTTFSPMEKLRVIHRTFQEINKEVTAALGDDYMWTMDDLFPVFQYVVVRAGIRHLGSEVLMIDDLMESHLQHGELGIMFTTLKACYFQIKREQSAHS